MSVQTDPLHRFGFIAGSVIAALIVGSLVVGLLSYFVIFGASSVSPEAGGFAILGVLGMASAVTWNGLTSHDDMNGLIPESWILRVVIVFLSIVYYNVVIAFAAGLALATSQSGMEVLPVVLAVLYPIYDAVSIRLGIPLSFAGILAIIVAIGLIPFVLAEEIEWSNVHIETALFGLLGHDDEPKRPTA